jgi:hypothetical protein
MATTNNQKRELRAVEAFQNAAATIGAITPGMNLFALTRGQFSMIDAVLACLDQIGPARLSIWTWCIAEYEVQCFDRLRMDARITDALLVIDRQGHKRNRELCAQWRETHGPESIRYVENHAKIATLESATHKLLLRGSMNLNYNPRFEQFDISEGCAGFDLIRETEISLPILREDYTREEVRAASKINQAWTDQQLIPFGGVKVWAK